jgi:hypothetical protein
MKNAIAILSLKGFTFCTGKEIQLNGINVLPGDDFEQHPTAPSLAEGAESASLVLL